LEGHRTVADYRELEGASKKGKRLKRRSEMP